MTNREGPFYGPPPAEVPLKNAPLVRVLAQLTFEEILSVSRRDFIASFQERIRATYRIFRSEEIDVVTVGATKQNVRRETIWRFYDAEEVWRVSLATNFVSLETRVYTSREDFVRRIGEIAVAADEYLSIGGFDRVGVRYIDQVQGEPLARIREMIGPAFLGVFAEADHTDAVQHQFSEMAARVAEGQMSARWGMLPANATYDVNVLPPVTQPSWFLDLDIYWSRDEGRKPVRGNEAADVAYGLATRAYTVFKWATNENFSKIYGG